MTLDECEARWARDPHGEPAPKAWRDMLNAYAAKYYEYVTAERHGISVVVAREAYESERTAVLDFIAARLRAARGGGV